MEAGFELRISDPQPCLLKGMAPFNRKLDLPQASLWPCACVPKTQATFIFQVLFCTTSPPGHSLQLPCDVAHQLSSPCGLHEASILSPRHLDFLHPIAYISPLLLPALSLLLCHRSTSKSTSISQLLPRDSRSLANLSI